MYKNVFLLLGCHWVNCDAVNSNHYNNLGSESSSSLHGNKLNFVYQNQSFCSNLEMAFSLKPTILLKTAGTPARI